MDLSITNVEHVMRNNNRKKSYFNFSKTFITDKEILGDTEYIGEKKLFNNSKYEMLDDSDIYDKVNNKLNNELEEEEEQ